MDLMCSMCGAAMKDGEPHCSQCKATMTCNAEMCECTCGNKVSADETKCDECLEM